MKQVTILFLKIAVILMGIPVLAFGIFLVPDIADFAAELYPDMAYIKYLVFIDLYASSVKALKMIKYCAITITILYVAGLPLFYLVGEKDDAPGVIVIGLIMVFASMVITFFAAILQMLLKEAIDIKSDNDLTI
ncbi:MAG: YoaS [Herbinix sp.]|nr:YoaS [Herbinix sp.]